MKHRLDQEVDWLPKRCYSYKYSRTIDADYRGEIKVILVNLSNEDFVIKDGERVAQMVIAKFDQISWEPTDSLEETERGTGGFGSTGTK